MTFQDPEEERKRREEERKEQKVAESRIQATPITPTHTQIAGGAGGGQQPGFLQQAGMQIGKKLLGGALGSLGGPLGGLLGGLFNNGGQAGLARDPVTGELLPYNVLATRMMQRRQQQQKSNGRIRARNNARVGGYKLINGKRVGTYNRNMGGGIGTLFGLNNGGRTHVPDDSVINGRFTTSHVPDIQRKNMGGPLANPHGYNEGGMNMETPMKRVMDEQKLDQQAMAFELEQKRKQEAHEQSMRIKEQQAKQAAAMKKASATTNKKPAKPKGPLSK